MDILKSPYEFRVDYDYGAATHNVPGEAPVDNPGTPKGQPKLTPKGQRKVGKVLHEFKAKTLHSGSKHGPIVTSRKQAIAIAYSESKRAKKK